MLNISREFEMNGKRQVLAQFAQKICDSGFDTSDTKSVIVKGLMRYYEKVSDVELPQP